MYFVFVCYFVVGLFGKLDGALLTESTAGQPPGYVVYSEPNGNEPFLSTNRLQQSLYYANLSESFGLTVRSGHVAGSLSATQTRRTSSKETSSKETGSSDGCPLKSVHVVEVGNEPDLQVVKVLFTLPVSVVKESTTFASGCCAFLAVSTENRTVVSHCSIGPGAGFCVASVSLTNSQRENTDELPLYYLSSRQNFPGCDSFYRNQQDDLGHLVTSRFEFLGNVSARPGPNRLTVMHRKRLVVSMADKQFFAGTKFVVGVAVANSWPPPSQFRLRLKRISGVRFDRFQPVDEQHWNYMDPKRGLSLFGSDLPSSTSILVTRRKNWAPASGQLCQKQLTECKILDIHMTVDEQLAPAGEDQEELAARLSMQLRMPARWADSFNATNDYVALLKIRIRVRPAAVVQLRPVLAQRVFLNTAPLTGRSEQHRLRVLAIDEGGDVKDVTTATRCTSVDSDVFKVTSDCQWLSLEPDATVGKDDAVLSMMYGNLTKNVSLSVYLAEFPLRLVLSDPVLNTIESWRAVPISTVFDRYASSVGQDDSLVGASARKRRWGERDRDRSLKRGRRRGKRSRSQRARLPAQDDDTPRRKCGPMYQTSLIRITCRFRAIEKQLRNGVAAYKYYGGDQAWFDVTALLQDKLRVSDSLVGAVALVEPVTAVELAFPNQPEHLVGAAWRQFSSMSGQVDLTSKRPPLVPVLFGVGPGSSELQVTSSNGKVLGGRQFSVTTKKVAIRQLLAGVTSSIDMSVGRLADKPFLQVNVSLSGRLTLSQPMPALIWSSIDFEDNTSFPLELLPADLVSVETKSLAETTVLVGQTSPARSPWPPSARGNLQLPRLPATQLLLVYPKSQGKGEILRLGISAGDSCLRKNTQPLAVSYVYAHVSPSASRQPEPPAKIGPARTAALYGTANKPAGAAEATATGPMGAASSAGDGSDPTGPLQGPLVVESREKPADSYDSIDAVKSRPASKSPSYMGYAVLGVTLLVVVLALAQFAACTLRRRVSHWWSTNCGGISVVGGSSGKRKHLWRQAVPSGTSSSSSCVDDDNLNTSEPVGYENATVDDRSAASTTATTSQMVTASLRSRSGRMGISLKRASHWLFSGFPLTENAFESDCDSEGWEYIDTATLDRTPISSNSAYLSACSMLPQSRCLMLSSDSVPLQPPAPPSQRSSLAGRQSAAVERAQHSELHLLADGRRQTVYKGSECTIRITHNPNASRRSAPPTKQPNTRQSCYSDTRLLPTETASAFDSDELYLTRKSCPADPRRELRAAAAASGLLYDDGSTESIGANQAPADIYMGPSTTADAAVSEHSRLFGDTQYSRDDTGDDESFSGRLFRNPLPSISPPPSSSALAAFTEDYTRAGADGDGLGSLEENDSGTGITLGSPDSVLFHGLWSSDQLAAASSSGPVAATAASGVDGGVQTARPIALVSSCESLSRGSMPRPIITRINRYETGTLNGSSVADTSLELLDRFDDSDVCSLVQPRQLRTLQALRRSCYSLSSGTTDDEVRSSVASHSVNSLTDDDTVSSSSSSSSAALSLCSLGSTDSAGQFLAKKTSTCPKENLLLSSAAHQRHDSLNSPAVEESSCGSGLLVTRSAFDGLSKLNADACAFFDSLRESVA